MASGRRGRSGSAPYRGAAATRASAPLPPQEPTEQSVATGLRERLERLAAVPGGSLLLLRAFLGVTFTFAGLQKLANPNFFKAGAPGSFDQQLRGAITTSPLHHLLSVATHAPVLVALLISFAEVAVGLATLLGLLGRLAALGGTLLALTFFLTISFNDNPYYYGADIVFVFAWTPLVLGGSGAWSLDALFARRAEEARTAVAVARARNSAIVRRRAAELDRRTFVQRATTIGGVGAAVLALGGIVAAVGRLMAPSRTPSSGGGSAIGGAGAQGASTTAGGTASPGTSAPPGGSGAKGTRIGPAKDVPVGGAATFTDPAQGVPAYVVQPKQGTFLAFSAICTHAGCQVEFDQQNESFICPCHASIFSAKTGAVLQGPAPSPLPAITVALGTNGQLYVDG